MKRILTPVTLQGAMHAKFGLMERGLTCIARERKAEDGVESWRALSRRLITCQWFELG